MWNQEKVAFSEFAPGTSVAFAEFNEVYRAIELVGPTEVIDVSLPRVDFDKRSWSDCPPHGFDGRLELLTLRPPGQVVRRGLQQVFQVCNLRIRKRKASP